MPRGAGLTSLRANGKILNSTALGTPAEFLQLVEQYGVIAIDGLEYPCVRPQDETLQKARFSGKKRNTAKAV